MKNAKLQKPNFKVKHPYAYLIKSIMIGLILVYTSFTGLFMGGMLSKDGVKDDAQAVSNYYWSGYADDYFQGGDGTVNSPYQIATARQLAYFANQVNSGNSYSGYYIALTNDIDLGAYKWMGIGVFAGTFDGQGYKISNIYMDDTISTQKTYISSGYNNSLGLFNYVSGATIKNIVLYNPKILIDSTTIAVENVGGIVGLAEMGSTIYNCLVMGDTDGLKSTSAYIQNITSASSRYSQTCAGVAGGVVGCLNSESVMMGCQNRVWVNGLYGVGGLVGDMRNASTIQGCVNYGPVTLSDKWYTSTILFSTTSSDNYCQGVGGIVGFNKYYVNGIDNEPNEFSIVDCANYGRIQNETMRSIAVLLTKFSGFGTEENVRNTFAGIDKSKTTKLRNINTNFAGWYYTDATSGYASDAELGGLGIGDSSATSVGNVYGIAGRTNNMVTNTSASYGISENTDGSITSWGGDNWLQSEGASFSTYLINSSSTQFTSNSAFNNVLTSSTYSPAVPVLYAGNRNEILKNFGQRASRDIKIVYNTTATVEVNPDSSVSFTTSDSSSYDKANLFLPGGPYSEIEFDITISNPTSHVIYIKRVIDGEVVGNTTVFYPSSENFCLYVANGVTGYEVIVSEMSYKGTGTYEHPYLIENEDDFISLAVMAGTQNTDDAGNIEETYYLQTADITLSSSNTHWDLFASGNIYNGGGYTIYTQSQTIVTKNDGVISNLYIVHQNSASGMSYINYGSLTAYNTGVINNVKLVKDSVNTSGYNIDIDATGSVNNVAPNTYPAVGSLVGVNNGVVEDCGSSIDLTVCGIQASVGGVVGLNFGGTIDGCFYTGTITLGLAKRNMTLQGPTFVGGVVGASEGGVINNNYFGGYFVSGEYNGVYAPASAIAGICGVYFDTSIDTISDGNSVNMQMQYNVNNSGDLTGFEWSRFGAISPIANAWYGEWNALIEAQDEFMGHTGEIYIHPQQYNINFSVDFCEASYTTADRDAPNTDNCYVTTLAQRDYASGYTFEEIMLSDCNYWAYWNMEKWAWTDHTYKDEISTYASLQNFPTSTARAGMLYPKNMLFGDYDTTWNYKNNSWFDLENEYTVVDGVDYETFTSRVEILTTAGMAYYGRYYTLNDWPTNILVINYNINLYGLVWPALYDWNEVHFIADDRGNQRISNLYIRSDSSVLVWDDSSSYDTISYQQNIVKYGYESGQAGIGFFSVLGCGSSIEGFNFWAPTVVVTDSMASTNGVGVVAGAISTYEDYVAVINDVRLYGARIVENNIFATEREDLPNATRAYGFLVGSIPSTYDGDVCNGSVCIDYCGVYSLDYWSEISGALFGDNETDQDEYMESKIIINNNHIVGIDTTTAAENYESYYYGGMVGVVACNLIMSDNVVDNVRIDVHANLDEKFVTTPNSNYAHSIAGGGLVGGVLQGTITVNSSFVTTGIYLSESDTNLNRYAGGVFGFVNAVSTVTVNESWIEGKAFAGSANGYAGGLNGRILGTRETFMNVNHSTISTYAIGYYAGITTGTGSGTCVYLYDGYLATQISSSVTVKYNGFAEDYVSEILIINAARTQISNLTDYAAVVGPGWTLVLGKTALKALLTNTSENKIIEYGISDSCIYKSMKVVSLSGQGQGDFAKYIAPYIWGVRSTFSSSVGSDGYNFIPMPYALLSNVSYRTVVNSSETVTLSKNGLIELVNGTTYGLSYGDTIVMTNSNADYVKVTVGLGNSSTEIMSGGTLISSNLATTSATLNTTQSRKGTYLIVKTEEKFFYFAVNVGFIGTYVTGATKVDGVTYEVVNEGKTYTFDVYSTSYNTAINIIGEGPTTKWHAAVPPMRLTTVQTSTLIYDSEKGKYILNPSGLTTLGESTDPELTIYSAGLEINFNASKQTASLSYDAGSIVAYCYNSENYVNIGRDDDSVTFTTNVGSGDTRFPYVAVVNSAEITLYAENIPAGSELENFSYKIDGTDNWIDIEGNTLDLSIFDVSEETPTIVLKANFIKLTSFVTINYINEYGTYIDTDGSKYPIGHSSEFWGNVKNNADSSIINDGSSVEVAYGSNLELALDPGYNYRVGSVSVGTLSNNDTILTINNITEDVTLDIVYKQIRWTDDGIAASAFASGDGTLASPYIINTAEQFGYFINQANTESGRSKHYQLGADIDLSGKYAAKVETIFTGSFNGNGHTISNYNLLEFTTFGGEEGAIFNNIAESGSVHDVIFDIESLMAGEFVSFVSRVNYGHIYNVGIVGNEYGISAPGSGVEGIASTNYGIIERCFVDVKPCVGVVMGIAANNYGTIKDVYSPYVQMMVFNNYGTIDNIYCANSGGFSAFSDSVIRIAYNGSVTKNVYACKASQIIEKINSGAVTENLVLLTEAEMTDVSNFPTFNFADTWVMKDSDYLGQKNYDMPLLFLWDTTGMMDVTVKYYLDGTEVTQENNGGWTTDKTSYKLFSGQSLTFDILPIDESVAYYLQKIELADTVIKNATDVVTDGTRLTGYTNLTSSAIAGTNEVYLNIYLVRPQVAATSQHNGLFDNSSTTFATVATSIGYSASKTFKIADTYGPLYISCIYIYVKNAVSNADLGFTKLTSLINKTDSETVYVGGYNINLTYNTAGKSVTVTIPSVTENFRFVVGMGVKTQFTYSGNVPTSNTISAALYTYNSSTSTGIAGAYSAVANGDLVEVEDYYNGLAFKVEAASDTNNFIINTININGNTIYTNSSNSSTEYSYIINSFGLTTIGTQYISYSQPYVQVDINFKYNSYVYTIKLMGLNVSTNPTTISVSGLDNGVSATKDLTVGLNNTVKFNVAYNTTPTFTFAYTSTQGNIYRFIAGSGIKASDAQTSSSGNLEYTSPTASTKAITINLYVVQRYTTGAAGDSSEYITNGFVTSYSEKAVESVTVTQPSTFLYADTNYVDHGGTVTFVTNMDISLAGTTGLYVRDLYTFNGWYDGSTQVSTVTSYVKENVTANVAILNARYTLKTYTITTDITNDQDIANGHFLDSYAPVVRAFKYTNSQWSSWSETLSDKTENINNIRSIASDGYSTMSGSDYIIRYDGITNGVRSYTVTACEKVLVGRNDDPGNTTANYYGLGTYAYKDTLASLSVSGVDSTNNWGVVKLNNITHGFGKDAYVIPSSGDTITVEFTFFPMAMVNMLTDIETTSASAQNLFKDGFEDSTLVKETATSIDAAVWVPGAGANDDIFRVSTSTVTNYIRITYTVPSISISGFDWAGIKVGENYYTSVTTETTVGNIVIHSLSKVANGSNTSFTIILAVYAGGEYSSHINTQLSNKFVEKTYTLTVNDASMVGYSGVTTLYESSGSEDNYSAFNRDLGSNSSYTLGHYGYYRLCSELNTPFTFASTPFTTSGVTLYTYDETHGDINEGNGYSTSRKYARHFSISENSTITVNKLFYVRVIDNFMTISNTTTGVAYEMTPSWNGVNNRLTETYVVSSAANSKAYTLTVVYIGLTYDSDNGAYYVLNNGTVNLTRSYTTSELANLSTLSTEYYLNDVKENSPAITWSGNSASLAIPSKLIAGDYINFEHTLTENVFTVTMVDGYISKTQNPTSGASLQLGAFGIAYIAPKTYESKEFSGWSVTSGAVTIQSNNQVVIEPIATTTITAVYGDLFTIGTALAFTTHTTDGRSPANNPGGTITIQNGSGYHASGSQFTLSYTKNAGYSFSKYQYSTDGGRTWTNFETNTITITTNTLVRGVFAENRYRITLSAFTGGTYTYTSTARVNTYGTSASGNFVGGTDVESADFWVGYFSTLSITANMNTGYRFKSWSSNISSSNSGLQTITANVISYSGFKQRLTISASTYVERKISISYEIARYLTDTETVSTPTLVNIIRASENKVFFVYDTMILEVSGATLVASAISGTGSSSSIELMVGLASSTTLYVYNSRLYTDSGYTTEYTGAYTISGSTVTIGGNSYTISDNQIVISGSLVYLTMYLSDSTINGITYKPNGTHDYWAFEYKYGTSTVSADKGNLPTGAVVSGSGNAKVYTFTFAANENTLPSASTFKLRSIPYTDISAKPSEEGSEETTQNSVKIEIVVNGKLQTITVLEGTNVTISANDQSVGENLKAYKFTGWTFVPSDLVNGNASWMGEDADSKSVSFNATAERAGTYTANYIYAYKLQISNAVYDGGTFTTNNSAGEIAVTPGTPCTYYNDNTYLTGSKVVLTATSIDENVFIFKGWYSLVNGIYTELTSTNPYELVCSSAWENTTYVAVYEKVYSVTIKTDEEAPLGSGSVTYTIAGDGVISTTTSATDGALVVYVKKNTSVTLSATLSGNTSSNFYRIKNVIKGTSEYECIISDYGYTGAELTYTVTEDATVFKVRYVQTYTIAEPTSETINHTTGRTENGVREMSFTSSLPTTTYGGVTRYDKYSQITFQAFTNTGYWQLRWEATGATINSNYGIGIVESLTSNITAVKFFAEEIYYTISISTQPATTDTVIPGTVTLTTDFIDSNNSVGYFGTASISAIANTNYVFSNWIVSNSQQACVITNELNSTTTVTNVRSAVDIVAVFYKQSIISYNTYNNATGAVADPNITARYEDYHFSIPTSMLSLDGITATTNNGYVTLTSEISSSNQHSYIEFSNWEALLANVDANEITDYKFIFSYNLSGTNHQNAKDVLTITYKDGTTKTFYSEVYESKTVSSISFDLTSKQIDSIVLEVNYINGDTSSRSIQMQYLGLYVIKNLNPGDTCYYIAGTDAGFHNGYLNVDNVSGYVFKGWAKSDNPTTILTTDHRMTLNLSTTDVAGEYYAIYNPKFNVTFTANTAGTANSFTGGSISYEIGSISDTIDSKYTMTIEYGKTIDLTATAGAGGYKFVKWTKTVGGVETDIDISGTATNQVIDSDATYTAYFVKTYDITVDVRDANSVLEIDEVDDLLYTEWTGIGIWDVAKESRITPSAIDYENNTCTYTLEAGQQYRIVHESHYLTQPVKVYKGILENWKTTVGNIINTENIITANEDAKYSLVVALYSYINAPSTISATQTSFLTAGTVNTVYTTTTTAGTGTDQKYQLGEPITLSTIPQAGYTTMQWQVNGENYGAPVTISGSEAITTELTLNYPDDYGLAYTIQVVYSGDSTYSYTQEGAGSFVIGETKYAAASGTFSTEAGVTSITFTAGDSVVGYTGTDVYVNSTKVGELPYTYTMQVGTTPTFKFVHKTNTWVDSGAYSTPSGAGTISNPYIINSASTLAWISAQALNGEQFNNTYFKQTANISLSGKLWVPIQNFNGIYVGNAGIVNGTQGAHDAVTITDVSVVNANNYIAGYNQTEAFLSPTAFIASANGAQFKNITLDITGTSFSGGYYSDSNAFIASATNVVIDTTLTESAIGLAISETSIYNYDTVTFTEISTETTSVNNFQTLMNALYSANKGTLKTINITQDIDCGNKILPYSFQIPSDVTVNGAGHVIKNLTLTGVSGLFSSVSGTVKNLYLQNVNLVDYFGEYSNYGLIVGEVTATGDVNHVYSSDVDITIEHTGVNTENIYIGGMFGSVYGNVERCENMWYTAVADAHYNVSYQNYNPTGTGSYFGLLVGKLAGTMKEVGAKTKADFTKVTISPRVGGLVGLLSSGTLENCYVGASNINLSESNVAGTIVHTASSGSITTSYLDATYSLKAANAVAKSLTSTTVTNVYVTNTATTATDANIVKTPTQMLTKSTYAGFDFTSVWMMSTNYTPVLGTQKLYVSTTGGGANSASGTITIKSGETELYSESISNVANYAYGIPFGYAVSINFELAHPADDTSDFTLTCFKLNGVEQTTSSNYTYFALESASINTLGMSSDHTLEIGIEYKQYYLNLQTESVNGGTGVVTNDITDTTTSLLTKGNSVVITATPSETSDYVGSQFNGWKHNTQLSTETDLFNSISSAITLSGQNITSTIDSSMTTGRYYSVIHLKPSLFKPNTTYRVGHKVISATEASESFTGLTFYYADSTASSGYSNRYTNSYVSLETKTENKEIRSVELRINQSNYNYDRTATVSNIYIEEVVSTTTNSNASITLPVNASNMGTYTAVFERTYTIDTNGAPSTKTGVLNTSASVEFTPGVNKQVETITRTSTSGGSVVVYSRSAGATTGYSFNDNTLSFTLNETTKGEYIATYGDVSRDITLTITNFGNDKQLHTANDKVEVYSNGTLVSTINGDVLSTTIQVPYDATVKVVAYSKLAYKVESIFGQAVTNTTYTSGGYTRYMAEYTLTNTITANTTINVEYQGDYWVGYSITDYTSSPGHSAEFITANGGTASLEVNPSTSTFPSDEQYLNIGARYNPFIISTPEQLARIAYLVNSGAYYKRYNSATSVATVYYKDASYKLTSDVDLGQYLWVPIGLNGYNNTTYSLGSNSIFGADVNVNITNMTIFFETEEFNDITNNYQVNIGLFGFVTNPGINNITIDNADIRVYSSKVIGIGAVVGYSYNMSLNNIRVVNSNLIGSFMASVGGYIRGSATNIYVSNVNLASIADYPSTSFFSALFYNCSQINCKNVFVNATIIRTNTAKTVYASGLIAYISGINIFENVVLDVTYENTSSNNMYGLITCQYSYATEMYNVYIKNNGGYNKLFSINYSDKINVTELTADRTKETFAGFDFNNIWYWDSATSMSRLRTVSNTASATTIAEKHVTSGTFNGTGTKDDPYLIEDADDLYLLAHYVNTNNTAYNKSGAYYKLTADLDMAGSIFTPIGTGIKPSTNQDSEGTYALKASFDGDYHTISNVYINSYFQYYSGLFGTLGGWSAGKDAVIKNINIINLKNYSASNFKGGLVGTLYSSKVENININVDLYGKANYLAGSIAHTHTSYVNSISKIYVSGICTAVVSNYGAGVIANIARGNSGKTLTISKAINSANMYGVIQLAAGILGYASTSTNSDSIVIEDCANKGQMSISQAYVRIGGILAEGSNVTINRCYNSATIIHTNQTSNAAYKPDNVENWQNADGTIWFYRIYHAFIGELVGRFVSGTNRVEASYYNTDYKIQAAVDSTSDPAKYIYAVGDPDNPGTTRTGVSEWKTVDSNSTVTEQGAYTGAGIKTTTDNLKNISMWSAFDFNTTWGMYDGVNDDMPTLKFYNENKVYISAADKELTLVDGYTLECGENVINSNRYVFEEDDKLYAYVKPGETITLTITCGGNSILNRIGVANYYNPEFAYTGIEEPSYVYAYTVPSDCNDGDSYRLIDLEFANNKFTVTVNNSITASSGLAVGSNDCMFIVLYNTNTNRAYYAKATGSQITFDSLQRGTYYFAVYTNAFYEITDISSSSSINWSKPDFYYSFVLSEITATDAVINLTATKTSDYWIYDITSL